MTPSPAVVYKGHRFPAEIIAHAVWLYFRFPLSYRQVEEILAARGIVVSYETIRAWGRKFGQTYANQLQRRRPQPGDNCTWMKSSSKSTARCITCGAPWISTATFWTFW